MPVKVPADWPEWPTDGLEYLGKCPVCGDAHRSLLHDNLIDRWFHAPGRWTMYKCEGCGSGYIDPRPNRATIGLAYANYETHRSADAQGESGHGLATRLRNGYLNAKYSYRMAPASRWGYVAMHLLPPPLRFEWDHYARHLPVPKAGQNKLLDVGCGNGEFLARARWQGWDVTGIDVDEAALAHAREAGISVVQGSIKPGRLAPASFDTITSHQVIEHTHAPVEFLQTLYTWLKPGGFLWIGTPNIASALHDEFGADWRDLHPPQHLVIFSASSLITTMHKCGFVDTTLVPRGYLDSHFYRQSMRMRNTEAIGDWSSLNAPDNDDPSIATQARLELTAWLAPGHCSDLVVTARKAPR